MDPVLLRAVQECMLTSSAPVNDICDKVSEILRKINDRVPAGALGKAKACPHILAVELACRSLNVMFSKERLMAQTSVSTKDVTQALTNCKSLLRLTFAKASAIDILSMQFGAGHKGAALALLADYQRLYVARLDKSRQLLVDLTASEYQTAAYFLAAKQQKAPPDKRKLLEVTEVPARLFAKIVEDLEKVCLRASSSAVEASAEAGGGSLSTTPTAGKLPKHVRVDGAINSRRARPAAAASSVDREGGGTSVQKDSYCTGTAKPQSLPFSSPPKAAVLLSGLDAEKEKEKENRANANANASEARSGHAGSVFAATLSVKTPSSSSSSLAREMPGDELEQAANAAAQRSIASCALLTKRKADPAVHAAALGLPALHQQALEKRRQEEEELRLQVEKRKEQEREMYALWKERTLKKRKLEQA